MISSKSFYGPTPANRAQQEQAHENPAELLVHIDNGDDDEVMKQKCIV